LYDLVERTPATVLLECAASDAETGSQQDPYSRLFTAPLRVCIASQPSDLALLFAEIESAVSQGLFAAGYFAYECGSFFEPTAALRSGRAGELLAWFGIYDRVHLFDHRSGAFVDSEPRELARFRGADQNDEAPAEPLVESSFGLTGQKYAQRIETIHDWIRFGDIYQLNFTVPIEIRAQGNFGALYRSLRARQPAPYCAFLHTQADRRILSFSPELFFRLEAESETRQITTRPMKGTAARGRTTREDRERAEWLRNDPKNRAENVMIVDLLRNDLGRLCHYGSVRAENLFAVERYPTIWQMTSTITGELRPEARFQDVFRALFPCGSITGAPKVRAMQLLAQIEDEPRGVYTGAIGYFSKQRSVFSVAIRTVELEGEHGKMGVGSGIVIDSDAGEEFRECLLKAEFLTQSRGRLPDSFCLVETLRWEIGLALIELHLDRLGDSADYFGFPCDRETTGSALVAHASGFTDGSARKVRLLVNADGKLEITDEQLAERVINGEPIRVRLANKHTDPSDPMLFHKTTHRPLYAEALKAATEDGFDDALFLNLRGEVTEGTISNVFVEKDGRWFTPPVECGLLAGIYRRHILETHPNAQERVLYLDDLRQADRIYLTNAVRGLRLAIVDWDN
jgi:para-aminobenzoate synthetase/4-amino-4-deoxychorismate lyase